MRALQGLQQLDFNPLVKSQPHLAGYPVASSLFMPEDRGAPGNEKGSQAIIFQYGGGFFHIRHHDTQLVQGGKGKPLPQRTGETRQPVVKIFPLQEIVQVDRDIGLV
jgi:hypothetical protein